MLRKLLGEEKGSAMILVTFSMIVLIGMAALVVDGGLEYVHKSQLQNAVDAAALAGSQGLTKDSTGVIASSIALTYLGKNGVTPPDTNKIVPSESNGSSCTKITVSATRKYYWGLAKIFNIKDADGKLVNSNNITATAAAQLQTITSMGGLAPIGALDSECQFNGLEVTLKCSSQTDIPTTTGKKWRGWIRLDGKQGAGYAEVIEDGSITPVEVGQYWDTQTGVVNAKPIRDAIMERVNGCHHSPSCTASSYVEGCPRIIYLPVVETDADGKAVFNDSSQVKIAGFAAFILTDYYEDQFIKGYFIYDVAPGDVNTGSASNFGVYTTKLVQ